MSARRKPTPEPEPEESEPVAPITTSIPAQSTLADDQVSEYETADGATYLLTAADAERMGAKAVRRPANKAVTPQNK